MKAVLEDMRSGTVSTYDIPAPELCDGGILVRTHFSAISAGTERAKLQAGEMSLVQKALHRPDLVRQVFDHARANGMRAAYQKVRSRLETLSLLGYSCSGTVVAVGRGVTEFCVGERVACGGVGYANHAEINFVPRNLAVAVPTGVPLEEAALTTIGAIAMQGLRQSGAVIGETIAVIGAGLVGVLTILLAKSAGCRVIAIDTDPDRAQRAAAFGADDCFVSSDPHLAAAVKQAAPFGADVSILTAATPSSEPIELAASIARDRGRIVVVGDVGMAISRRAAYAKELSITCSRSYGPGRYDPSYEEAGVDYPIGHVRWTERRNMEAFVDLLARKKIDVSPLIELQNPVEQSDKAFASIVGQRAYTVLLRYTPLGVEEKIPRAPANGNRRDNGKRHELSREILKIGCIGAGGFARDVIFPAVQAAHRVVLESVASASGVTAESARNSAGFRLAQAPAELLGNPDVNAVFILSRHDTHASYVASAIANRKAVFVEKPLATTHEQMTLVRDAYQAQIGEGNSPFVMVGFNRRFAPFTEQILNFFVRRREPVILNVRVNAGFLPKDHWTQQAQGGGRIVGELCHFVDLARSIVAAPIENVSASALPDCAKYNRDNVLATLTFADGSLANLIYVANGDKAVSKEQLEVFCEGAVARMEDFQRLELVRAGKSKVFRSKRDKGHQKEIALTLQAIRSGQDAPIPFEQLLEVTAATFAIEESISLGQPVRITTWQQTGLRTTAEQSFAS
jgi:predicted dehydrogenase